MRILAKFRPFIAVISLGLAALACNRSVPTVTPAPSLPPLPSPTSSPLPSPTPTSSPIVPATDTPSPLPSSTPTPVLPSACPPLGDPLPPDRPATFSDYARTLAAYLSAGGSAPGLTRLLRDWGAVSDDVGQVRSLDLTGDLTPEVVAALMDPAPEFDLPAPAPPGDVLIFQCQGGAVVPAYQGRAAAGQEMSDLNIELLKVEDVNGTGRADVVYRTGSCGAHTCWERLYIIEWDGTDFVNRIPDLAEQPYPTFTVSDGQVVVNVGGIGSAGAGYQRGYSEVWTWDGKLFALAEQLVGPPTALIHYIHDGDAALTQGDYGGAINHDQAALEDTGLPAGLFLESEEEGAIIVRAYAHFKLVVAYAAAGDERAARSQYDLLVSEHPEGSPGHPYALLGRAFWDDFVVTKAPRSACTAAVALAESDPTLAERLYAGYANPEYEPADLCRLE